MNSSHFFEGGAWFKPHFGALPNQLWGEKCQGPPQTAGQQHHQKHRKIYMARPHPQKVRFFNYFFGALCGSPRCLTLPKMNPSHFFWGRRMVQTVFRGTSQSVMGGKVPEPTPDSRPTTSPKTPKNRHDPAPPQKSEIVYFIFWGPLRFS